MDKRRNLNQKGQTLVIVALLLIGLLATLGLVLDGGNMYFQRRQAQLAADAGALAGARAYCLTESVDAAVNSAWDYAVNRNSVDNANISVAADTGYVTVDTDLTFDAFFMGMFGNPQLSVSATATAVCSPPTSARDVLPVAWSCRPPAGEGEPSSDSEDCVMYWMDHDPDNTPGECVYGDDPIYLVMDSIKVEEEIVCQDPDSPPPSGEEGVIYIDCDTDNDGINDLAMISGGNRAWLNLDGGSPSASDLKDWIENGYDDVIYPHTWIPGSTGNMTSVYKAVNDNLIDQDVIIPVFNDICAEKDPPSASNGECDWHSGQDTIVSTNGNADYFHIISFSLFRITCVDAGSSHCEAREAAGLDYYFKNSDLNSINTIEGCFIEGFDPNLGSGGGQIETGALVVHLVH
jgi:hypothetical protein